MSIAIETVVVEAAVAAEVIPETGKGIKTVVEVTAEIETQIELGDLNMVVMAQATILMIIKQIDAPTLSHRRLQQQQQQ